MPKQGLAIIFPCNLQIWTVGSSSLEGKCLTGFLVFKLLLIKIASFSMECWNCLKKKKSLPSVNIMDDFSSKELLSSLPISQRLPQSCLFYSSCCCRCSSFSPACSLEGILNLIQLCQEVWGCKVLRSQK